MCFASGCGAEEPAGAQHITAHPLALQREQLKLKEGVRRRRVLSGREVKVSLLTQIFVSLSTVDFLTLTSGQSV